MRHKTFFKLFLFHCFFACLILHAPKIFSQTFFGERVVLTSDVVDPIAIYSVDLDNDGDIDIVSGSYEDNKIAWYENDGNGNFSAQQVISNYLTHVTRFYPMDKDCDGDVDFFAEYDYSDSGFSYAWLQNNNDFSSQWDVEPADDQSDLQDFFEIQGDPVIDDTRRYFNFSDYNADGVMDFVNPYFYIQGNCQWGAFDSIITTPVNVDINFLELWKVDIDGDNLDDYVASGWGSPFLGYASQVYYKKNLGGGLYQNWEVLVGNIDDCKTVALGDIDGDGDIDLVATAYNADQVIAYYNDGNGAFSNPEIICNTIDRPQRIYSEDMDNDGDDDIIVIGKNDIKWIESYGDGDFSETVLIDNYVDNIYTISYGFRDLSLFLFDDYDDDGDLDMVYADIMGNEISYYENYQLKVDAQPMDTSVCPGETLVLSIASETAEDYQWFVDNGTGFTAVEDNAQYSGAQTDSLNILNAVESLSGNLYFCEISVSAGSTVSDTITLYVGDTIPPQVLSQPGDQEIGDASSCMSNLPDFTGMFSFSDNCDPSPVIVQDPAAGTEIYGAVNDILFTISDASGNTTELSINVAVSDTTAPSIASGPPSQEVSANENCSFILPDYSDELNVLDNCDPEPEITQIPAAGIESSDVSIPVSLTATDNTGNSSTYAFTLTVLDNDSPDFISSPGDQVLIADNNCQSTLPDYIAMCTIQDNCDNEPSVQQTPPAGSIVSGAVNSVQILAEDEAGNVSSHSFNVEVQDTTAPLITSILNDMIIGDSIACTVNLPDYTSLLSGYDNCDDPLIKEQQPLPGTPVSGLNNPVVLSLIDNSGNVSQTSFLVSVADTSAPEFLTSIENQDIIASENCDYQIPDFTDDVLFTDLCDANPSITQMPVPGTISDAETQSVQLLLEDESGNQNMQSFYLNKQDTTRPAIQYAPEDQTHYLNALCEFTVPDFTDSVQAIDNCDNALSIVQTPPAGTIVSTNEVDVLIQVTDDFGNQENADFTITLLDTIAPAFANILHDTIIGDAVNCEHVLPDFTSLPGISDNCDANPQISQNPAAGTLISGVDNEVTLILSDESGNFSNMHFNVAVMDTSAPAILESPSTQTMYSDDNCQYIMPDFTNLVVAEDNCSDSLQTVQNPEAGQLISNPDQLVSLLVSDPSGNESQTAFSVLMADSIAPVFTSPISDVWLGDGLSCEAVLPDYTRQADVSDNCDPDPVILQAPAPGTVIAGDTCIVSLSVLDSSNNSSTVVFHARVMDLEAPAISNVPENQSLYCDSSCLAVVPDYLSQIQFSDNCDNTPELFQAPPAGAEISGQENNLQIRAVDYSGNESSVSFNISVTDSISPSIHCQDSISIRLANGETWYKTQGTEFDPIYFDNCIIPDLTNDKNHHESLEGVVFPIGEHGVIWTVTDDAGNETSCYSSIRIIRSEGVLLEYGMSIYPNPNDGNFIIDFGKNEVKKLNIYNSIGQLMLSDVPAEQEEQVSIENFSSGMYLVQIHLANDVVTNQIIVD
ncbi:MAG: T9SS type A sorting domain-containing protein [Bacteroidales bacterium]